MEKRPLIMTVKEVAKYLRMSEMSVYRMCKQGAIPAYKMGKVWRFKKDEIEQWFSQKTNNYK
ncbi:TPA: DNA-binding protein [bacterium]|nr:DNA-binding protein [bacterium]